MRYVKENIIWQCIAASYNLMEAIYTGITQKEMSMEDFCGKEILQYFSNVSVRYGKENIVHYSHYTKDIINQNLFYNGILPAGITVVVSRKYDKLEYYISNEEE